MKTNKTAIKTLGVLCLALILSVSCVDDRFSADNIDENAELNLGGDITVPLVYSKIEVKPLFDKLIGSESENFVQKGDMFYFVASGQENFGVDGITIDAATSVDDNINVSGIPSGTVPPGSITMPPANINFSFAGASSPEITRLDKFTMNSGTLSFLLGTSGITNFDTSEGKNITVEITFPEGFSSPNVVGGKRSFKLNDPDVGPTLVEIDLAGAEIDLTKNMDFSIGVTLTSDGSVENSGSPSISFEISISDIQPDVVWGLFNPSIAQDQIQNFVFDVFDDLFSGADDIPSFKGAGIYFEISSNVGIPLVLDISEIKASRAGDPEATYTINDKKFDINAPSIGQEGASITTNFSLSDADGIGELFKVKPDNIAMTYSCDVDPDAAQHFVPGSPSVSVGYNVEVPLYFGSDMKMSSDQRFDDVLSESITDMLPADDNAEIELRLFVENHLPLAIDLSFSFLAENNSELLKITPLEKIKPGQINPTTHQVTKTVASKVVFKLGKSDIEKLKNARHIVLTYTLAGNGTDDAKLTASDFFNIFIEMHAKGNVNISGDSDN